MIGNCLQSWISTGYFSNSTGSSVTVSPIMPPLHTQAEGRDHVIYGESPRLSHPKGCGCWDSRFVWSRALKDSVKWERTMLRDHCIFCWWKKRGNSIALVIYFHFFFSFSLFLSYTLVKMERAWWKKKEGFTLLFANDCATCAWYASIGTQWSKGDCPDL
jgi:hypothetical protein